LYLFDPFAAHLFSVLFKLSDRPRIDSRSYSPRYDRGEKGVAARTGLEPVHRP
jgi:hypothetical protein